MKLLNEDHSILKLAISPEAVKILIENGIDVNVKDDGWTALMIAARIGNTDIVKMLLERGADVNAVNEEDETALYLAIENGQTETIQILKDAGGKLYDWRKGKLIDG